MEAMEQIGAWLPRFTGLVLGPGLGRFVPGVKEEQGEGE